MKLSEEQIKKVEQEAAMYLVFDPNHIIEYSKYMWNHYRLAVRVEFKNGDFYRAKEI